MKVVGLIVEYNPLHNGHVYHYKEALAVTGAEASVIVMSGHFLQRGEPALVNKWARTRMALEMGVDLVFELPYVYSTQQAELFAFGSVALLNQLPFVTHLCFGSESGDLEALSRAARILATESTSFKAELRARLNDGQSYARAMGEVLSQRFKAGSRQDNILAQPNNILGLYYLLALHRLNSPIQPVTIRRIKAGYHQIIPTDTHIASATSIRQAVLKSPARPDWSAIKPYLPPYTYKILQEEYNAGRGLISWEDFYPFLRYAFLSLSAEELGQIFEIEEGIQHRFKSSIPLSHSVQELIEKVKTKRYTWNRIQRMLVHTLTHCRKKDVQRLNLSKGPAYLRLLGYSEKGRKLLNQYKKELAIPLITNIRKERPPMLDWDLKASQIYQLAYTSEAQRANWKMELAQPPISSADLFSGN